MKKIFDFIKRHNDVAFATVDKKGNPAIRIFQIMLISEDEKRLYFATSPKKEVWMQLQNNPNIEILAFADNVSVRISGKANFNISDETSRQIYNENLVLQRIYSRYTDLVYFSLPVKKVDYFDLNPTIPVLESYNF